MASVGASRSSLLRLARRPLQESTRFSPTHSRTVSQPLNSHGRFVCLECSRARFLGTFAQSGIATSDGATWHATSPPSAPDASSNPLDTPVPQIPTGSSEAHAEVDDWYLDWDPSTGDSPAPRRGPKHPKRRPRVPIDDEVRDLTEAEIKQYLSWKNKVRHSQWLKDLRAGKPTPANPKFQIQKLGWLLEHGGVEEMAAAWATLDPARRLRIWPNIMSSAMRACPEKVLPVLRATLDPPPLGYAVQDTVQFLALWQRTLPRAQGQAEATALVDTISDILRIYEQHGDTRLIFRQNPLYHLRTLVPISKLEELYKHLMRHNQRLHPQTLLQLASGFAKSKGSRDTALQIATAVANAGGADLTSPGWASLCTTLLSPPSQNGDDDVTTSTVETFEDLLQHGLVPNLVNYTALVRGLCASGRLDTAWDIVHIMETHEISPDSVFASTLLDGGRQSQSVDDIARAVEMAIKHDIVDTPFLNSLLSSIFDFAVQSAKRQKIHSPQIVPSFGPMLFYYSKLFHLEPLQHLIPIDLAKAAEVGPKMPQRWEAPSQLFPILDRVVGSLTDKMHPTGTTLALMYIAYVKSLSKASSVLSLYTYLRLLVLRGNKVCASFMEEKKTLLHDVVIARLCEHPGMLRAALDVVGDMLKEKTVKQAAVEAATPTEGKRPRPSHPIPSEYTWNILMQGFMAHNETASAERVMNMMQENGVQPTLVTWNTLLSGYARAQNVNKVMATLEKIEQQGFEANEYTMRAFARVARKESVLRQLEDAMAPDQNIHEELAALEGLEAAVPLE